MIYEAENNKHFQMHQRAKCSETGWGWEAEWGEYALRNVRIQMGVSKTCGWGWVLSFF